LGNSEPPKYEGKNTEFIAISVKNTILDDLKEE
jgi:hypothetical protein